MSYLIPAVKDNAVGNLGANVTTSSTSIVLATGDGANFPQPIDGTATSTGTSTTLNCTGIQALGVSVGDAIVNLTDSTPSTQTWSAAIVTAVTTDSVTTTPLKGGTDNTWESGDSWVVKPIVVNLSVRTGDVLTGAVEKFEKVLVTSISGDTLTIPAVSGFRGYDGTTINNFSTGDFVTGEVDQSRTDGLFEAISRAYRDLAQDADVVHNAGAENIAGIKTFTDVPKISGTPVASDDVATIGAVAGLIGVGTKTLVADGSISVNKPVFVTVNGEFKEAQQLSSGTVYQLDGGTNIKQSFIKNITAEKWLCSWVDNAGDVYARVLDRDANGDFTAPGSTLTVDSTIGTTGRMFMTKIDATKFRLYVEDVTNDNIECYVLNISGDTVTVGTTSTVSVGNSQGCKFGELPNGDVAISLVGFSSPNYSSTIVFIQGEFTATTRTSPLGLAPSGTYTIWSQPIAVDNTTVLVTYAQNGVSPVIGIVSTTNSNVDSETLNVSTNTTAYEVYLVPFGSGKFYAFHKYGQAMYTATGSTLTKDSTGDTVEDLSGIFDSGLTSGSNQKPSPIEIQSNLSYFFTGSSIYKINRIDDNTISSETMGGSKTDSKCNSEIVDASTDIYELVSGCETISDDGPVTFKLRTTQYTCGIARQTVADGENLTATTIGGTHDTESGLIPGLDYTLEGITFGKAISSTEVLFDIPPRNNPNT